MGGRSHGLPSLITATAELATCDSRRGGNSHARQRPDLLMMLLKQQRDDDCYGSADRLRALPADTTRVQAGSEEVIVCSLFHDVGEKIALLSWRGDRDILSPSSRRNGGCSGILGLPAVPPSSQRRSPCPARLFAACIRLHGEILRNSTTKFLRLISRPRLGI
jgi:hypothetical protein